MITSEESFTFSSVVYKMGHFVGSSEVKMLLMSITSGSTGTRISVPLKNTIFVYVRSTC